MNSIDQYIRNKILEQTEVNTPSGYKIKILSSHYGNTDIERVRSKYIKDRAIANGCDYGLGIVATKKNKSGNDDLLIQDIVATMKQNPDILKYFSKDYRIILSKPRETGKRRKFFAVWIVDMSNKSLFANKLKLLQQRLAKQTRFQDIISKTMLLSDEKSGSDIITQTRAIVWSESIVKIMQDLYAEQNTNTLYKELFPTESVAKEFKNAIPDFSDMLFGVKIDDDDVSKEQTKSEIVTIDWAWLEKNKTDFNFRGTANVILDPITAQTKVVPIEGKIYTAGAKSMDATDFLSNKIPWFDGKFDNNGAPSEGKYYFNVGHAAAETSAAAAGYPPTESEWLASLTESEPAIYVGTMQITNIKKSNDKTIKFLSGKLYYYPKGGDTTLLTFDEEWPYFDGTYKAQTPDNGDIFSYSSKNSKYTRTYQVVNGDLKKKTVSYPYVESNTGYKFYIDSKTNQVYAYDSGCGCWISVNQNILLDLIDKTITVSDFATKVTPITDPVINAGLCTTFNVDDEFKLIKQYQTKEQFSIYKEQAKNFSIAANIEYTAGYEYMYRLRNYTTTKNDATTSTNSYTKIAVVTELNFDTTTAKFTYKLLKSGKFTNKTTKKTYDSEYWVLSTDLF